jgi:exocyst complex component 2
MLISLSSLDNIYYLTSVIDNKSLRLITDASVSSPISREKSQGLDPNMRGRFDGVTGILLAFDSCLLRGLFFCTFADKVIYSSPNFDPKVFLSWVHKDTSAADLEVGALTLKTDLKGRTQQKK